MMRVLGLVLGVEGAERIGGQQAGLRQYQSGTHRRSHQPDAPGHYPIVTPSRKEFLRRGDKSDFVEPGLDRIKELSGLYERLIRCRVEFEPGDASPATSRRPPLVAAAGGEPAIRLD